MLDFAVIGNIFHLQVDSAGHGGFAVRHISILATRSECSSCFSTAVMFAVLADELRFAP